MKKNKIFNPPEIVLLILFYTGVAMDIFYFNLASDWRYLFLLIIWILILKIFKLTSKATFILSLAFLILLFIFFIIARTSAVTEKIAAWIYLTLFVGVIQQLLELRKEAK